MEISDIPFPKCYKDCEMVKFLGCGECESVCPWKFEEELNEEG